MVTKNTDRQDAQQKAMQITRVCDELHFKLDPIDWLHFGLQAIVSINTIKIAPLSELYQREPDDLLRTLRIKLLEHAALAAIPARPGLKATMWSPVEVVQPQDFLSLWVITLETEERIAICERLKDGQRVYEPYHFNSQDHQQLAALFGPMSQGEYQLGEKVTIMERNTPHTGEIIYIVPPGKVAPNRHYSSKGHHLIAGKAYTNETSARYLVDCHDGFPHIVKQSQVAR